MVEFLFLQTAKNSVRHGNVDSARRDAASTSDSLETPDFYERYRFDVSWLEAHRSSGRNVEMEAIGFQTIEIQVRIGLNEMEMRADLL